MAFRTGRMAAVSFCLLSLLFLPTFPPAAADVCAGISTASDSSLTSVRIASGLVRAVFVTAPPEDVSRTFIVEQDGRIRLLKNGVLLTTPFLDITSIVRSQLDVGGSEEGLLGLAFHPDYATNGWFFVYHTDGNGNNVVARYERSGTDTDRADATSREDVINFSHPSEGNHNGGMIAFGPDGFLYIGTGDGGGGCDASGNAQNPASKLGKLLRIDVDALPYTVPSTNPFVGVGGFSPEIWALGLRNPWRWSFDRLTGDLYIGDVGQNLWEEIDFVASPNAGGQNYGWVRYEGMHCAVPSGNGGCGDRGSCTISGYKSPVVEYPHAEGCSVSGGYAYRGCRMPSLHGTYFYSDFCTSFIRSFRMSGGAVTDQRNRTGEIDPDPRDISQIASYGEDARGELYIVEQGGEVYKIVPILPNLEVCGSNAVPFALGKLNWTWEDLQATSSHPITSYRVYRQTAPGGTFTCVRQGATPSWAGGDPAVPPPGTLYAYVVTAVNAAGEQTSPGTGSDGTPRVLSGTACP